MALPGSGPQDAPVVPRHAPWRASSAPEDRAETQAAAVTECCAVQMMHSTNPNSCAAFLDALSTGTRSAFTRLGTRLRYSVGDVLIHEGDHVQELTKPSPRRTTPRKTLNASLSSHKACAALMINPFRDSSA